MKLRILFLLFLGFISTSSWAQMVVPSVQLGLKSAQSPKEVVGVLQILVMLTVLSLAPAILIMMTSFTRIIVILSFLRQALGTNNMPPNQLLVGLALFLTFVVMGPTLKQVNENALQPFLAGKISQMEGLEKAKEPVKAFMLKHVRPKDLDLMASLTEEKAATKEDISFLTLVPAFLISELKTSFQIGFIIYLPFLILDMVVASVLMAMGMMMLPPVIISLPFKLMLFVLVDGWQLIVGSIVKSFG